MRSIFAILGLSVAASSAFGAACVSQTYDQYVALGAGGCTIGTTVFNNFGSLSFVNTGVPTLPPQDVLVTPGGSPLAPTLSFTYVSGANHVPTPETVNTSGSIFSMGLSYDLTPNAAILTSLQINSTFTNNSPGSASTTKTAQLAGGGPSFISTVSDGGITNPLATYNGSQINPTGTGVWVITDTVSLQAQSTGSVTQNGFANLFGLQNQVVGTPEPLSALLIGSGLICLGLMKRKAAKS
jgi:hypothetical protein